MFYARGGYVNSKLKATFNVPAGVTTPAPVAGNNNGFLLGAGVEHGFSDKISARAEFRYFNFKGPISRNQLVVGLAYHF